MIKTLAFMLLLAVGPAQADNYDTAKAQCNQIQASTIPLTCDLRYIQGVPTFVFSTAVGVIVDDRASDVLAKSYATMLVPICVKQRVHIEITYLLDRNRTYTTRGYCTHTTGLVWENLL